MAEAGFVFKGDAAQFFQEVAKMATQWKTFQEEIKKTTGETKKLTEEEKTLAREGKRALEEIRGPQEQYARRMRALNDLLREGKIGQQEFAEASRRAQGALEGQGKAGENAFGANALGKLASFAGGVLSIGAAVRAVTGEIQAQVQELNRLAETRQGAAPAVGMLAQLAKGDKAKMAELMATAGQIYEAGGAPSYQEAARVTYQLGSAGALGEAGFASELAALAGPEGVAPMLGKAGKLREAFGAKETGDYKAIFSKASAAARPLTDVGISQILEAAAEAAGPAKALGLSDEETFAVVSKVAEVYSPEKAGTSVSALLSTLSKQGFGERFAGKSLADMLASIPETTARETLGITEMRAFQRLGPAGLRARTGEVRGAEQAGAITEDIRLANLANLPERELLKSTAREQRQREEEAEQQTSFEDTQSRMRKRSREAGEPEWATRLQSWVRAGVSGVVGPETANKMWSGFVEDTGAAAKGLKEAAAELRQAARARPQRPVQVES